MVRTIKMGRPRKYHPEIVPVRVAPAKMGRQSRYALEGESLGIKRRAAPRRISPYPKTLQHLVRIPPEFWDEERPPEKRRGFRFAEWRHD